MKAILLLVAIVGLTSAWNLRISASIPANVVHFIEGLLEGCEVDGGQVHDCIQCLKDGETDVSGIEDAIAKFKQAMSDFSHIDWAHISNLMEGVELIIEAAKELFADISASVADCKLAIPEVEALIADFANIDVKTVAWAIVQDLLNGKLVGDIKKAISSFGSGDWESAGEAIGEILFDMIPPRVNVDPTVEVEQIVKGLLEGFKIPGEDLPKIMECLKDVPNLVANIQVVITELEEVFKNFSITTLVDVLVKLFQIVQEVMTDLEPCGKSVPEFQKIWAKIENIVWKEWVKRLPMDLIMHGAEIFSLIKDAMNNWNAQEFETFGQNIGRTIYILLFEEDPPETDVNVDPTVEVEQIVKGLLEGFKIPGEDLPKIMECLKDVPNLVANIQVVITELEEVFKNFSITTLVDVLVKLFQIVQEVMTDLEPCGKSVPEFQKIWAKIENIVWKEWVKRLPMDLIMHGAEIFSLIKDAMNNWNAQEFETFGQNIGRTIYILLFEEDPPKEPNVFPNLH